jgi:hypothetical protein
VQSIPCTKRRGARISWLSLKTKVDGLSVVWPQNHCDWFPALGLKTECYGLVIWASKSPRWFLGFGIKTKRDTISRLHHKIDERMRTGHASKYIGLLRVEASRARVSQSSLKTGGAAARMVQVTLSRRLRRVEAEHAWVNAMGCVGPSIPTLSFSLYEVLGAF